MNFLLPFGEYLPDQPEFGNQGSSRIENVVALSGTSYGPVGSLQQISSTGLYVRAQGARAVLTDSNELSAKLYAGDATRLYSLVLGTAGAAWQDLSRAVPGDYTIPAQDQWQFASYGTNVYAFSRTEYPQVSVSGGAFANAAGPNPIPKAKFAAVVRDFLMLGSIADGTDLGSQTLRWSGINAPDNFPAPGTSAALAVQSDQQPLPGNHGAMTGLVPSIGQADAIVFFQRAVYRVDYVGAPVIFEFKKIEGARGLSIPYAWAPYGSIVFYVSEDGICATDGTSSTLIGDGKVDRTFFQDFNQGYARRLKMAVDLKNQTLWVCYPDVTSMDGTPNKALLYRIDVKRWTLVTGLILEEIASLPADRLLLTEVGIGGADVGNVPMLAVFDPGAHAYNVLNGATLQATLETTELQPNSQPDPKSHVVPGRSRIRTARPMIQGGATATASIGVRDQIGATVAWGADVQANAYGLCPVRSAGRFVRSRVTVPAGAVWTHAQGVELQLEPAGDR